MTDQSEFQRLQLEEIPPASYEDGQAPDSPART